MKKLDLAFILCLLAGQVFPQSAPQLGKDKIKDVVAAMTLEEKVSIVMGMGRNSWKNPKEGKPTVIVPGAAGSTYSIARLGITPTILADGPAGLRIIANPDNADGTRYCTAFPTATAMASAWNTDLEENVGKAMGNEVLEYGCDVLLAPAMNIQRNPLNGRNFEYFSEDPIVAGKMAAAFVRGIQSQGVGTSVKHFAANNQETNRHSINEVISQRALREIYLRGFEIAIKESSPWTVMSSYNRINGFHTAENYDLLTTILRKEWGFKGMVMTDWTSGTDWVNQMYAGNEMIMPGEKKQAEELLKAVIDGRLDEKVLDENVSCILEYIMKTPRFKDYHYSNKPNLKENDLVALQAAEEGMVLLKNDNNTLPFRKVKEVALFGKTSYHFITGGTGSGEVNYNHAVSLQEGLENAKYKLTAPLKNQYVTIIDSVLSKKKDDAKDIGGKLKFAIDRMDEINLSDELINSSVKTSDIAIITLGRTTGEGSDRKENNYFILSDAEQDMIRKVCNAYHAAKKKVVVVLNIGGPIETESWKNYPDAIFSAWQTGQEGGNAIAEILSGKVNPSGKTAQTFPVKYADVPSSSTFPGEPSENPINSFYTDGIYVGYRYYDSFNVKPSYEFGYGLSYTTFKYSDLKLSSPTFNDKMNVTVTITNTGKVAGKEVVQLYLSAPQDKIEKPVQELKGFAKTSLLKPNESQTLTFTLDGRALASYWSSISAWVADAGKYEVKIGASSRDIKATASFNLDKSTVVEKEHYVLYPDRYVKEISVKDKK